MPNEQNGNKPVAEVRDGALRIALFKNEAQDEGGRTRYSGKLTRSYRDAAGDWHDTDYLSATEFLRAARLMEKAYDAEIAQRKAEHDSEPTP
jgi:hypothetical protein